MHVIISGENRIYRSNIIKAAINAFYIPLVVLHIPIVLRLLRSPIISPSRSRSSCRIAPPLASFCTADHISPNKPSNTSIRFLSLSVVVLWRIRGRRGLFGPSEELLHLRPSASRSLMWKFGGGDVKSISASPKNLASLSFRARSIVGLSLTVRNVVEGCVEAIGDAGADEEPVPDEGDTGEERSTSEVRNG